MSTQEELFQAFAEFQKSPESLKIKSIAKKLATMCGDYKNLAENESVSVTDEITSQIIADFYEKLSKNVEGMKKPEEVTDVAVLFCGFAGEIDAFLEKATHLKKLSLLDLNIDKGIVKDLKERTPAKVEEFPGNTFERIADLPENSQDFVTVAGAEFLFDARNPAYRDKVQGFPPEALASMHRVLLEHSVARILRPNGIVYAQDETARAFIDSPLFKVIPDGASTKQFFQYIGEKG